MLPELTRDILDDRCECMGKKGCHCVSKTEKSWLDAAGIAGAHD